MNRLQSFMSDSRLSVVEVTLEDPQPAVSMVRIKTYAAFESAMRSDSGVAESSPLVRWAAVELLAREAPVSLPEHPL